jgi:hypothetical protein
MSSKIIAGTTSGTALNMSADTSGILEIQTGSGPTSAVTVNASQNVGIGTTNPTFKLDTQSTNSALANFQLTSGTNAYMYLQDTARSFAMFSNNGTWGIYDNTSSAQRLQIDSSGNMAVNAASPAFLAKFYVNSPSTDIIVGANGGTKEFAVANNGQIYAQFTSISSLSDRRAKENIEPIKYGLEEVTKLNPVTFNFIAHPELAPTYGFIAQDVQPVLPELVNEEKDNKAEDGTPYLTLKMGDMLPVLVKAIQELNAKVTALEAQLGAK